MTLRGWLGENHHTVTGKEFESTWSLFKYRYGQKVNSKQLNLILEASCCRKRRASCGQSEAGPSSGGHSGRPSLLCPLARIGPSDLRALFWQRVTFLISTYLQKSTTRKWKFSTADHQPTDNADVYSVYQDQAASQRGIGGGFKPSMNEWMNQSINQSINVEGGVSHAVQRLTNLGQSGSTWIN